MLRFFKLATVLVLAMSLFACAGGGQKVEVLKLLSQPDQWDPNDFSNPATVPAQRLEKLTGQKVEYVMLPSSDTMSKLQLDLAGGVKYNFLKLTKDQYNALAPAGALLDISAELKKDGPNITKDGVISAEMWKTVTTNDGQILGIPEKNSFNHVNTCFVVRKDILDKLGLPMPTTTAELLDLSKKLLAKGIETPIRLTLPIPHGIRGAFGFPNNWNERDGKLVYYGADPEFKQFADYMKSLYDAGAFGKGAFTASKWDDALASFATGKAVFLQAAWWNAPAINSALRKATAGGTQKPEQDLQWILSFVGPTGEKGVFRDKGVSYVEAVPKYMKSTASQVIKYLNVKFDPKIYVAYMLGDEGKDYIREGDTYKPGPSFDPKARADWYQTGAPEALWAAVWPVSIYGNKDMYQAWSTIQAKNEEFGRFDIVKLTPSLPLLGKTREQLDAIVNEEYILYVQGKSNNLDKLASRLNDAKLGDVDKEINDWYVNFKK